ncbi:acyltransferase family protein [Streptomyces chartreusis]|uniref:Acyltransferase family protein n=1 Tax=Streptomyces chartreusis NRRL 3882 TaxID=1079985 RepID=A0A2N9B859_STRCX|nr:acyltransferase family protein [Streptomyces sp. SID5464]SOR79534.1 Acyltransferase family protein [Streptomyces chartreusis NRRL 3882]
MTETVVSTRKPRPEVAVLVEPPGATTVPRRRKDSGGRLRALDGLRLVAALMVAAYHYGGRDGEVSEAWGTSPKEQFPTLHEYFAYGCLGVQVFFVISGFVICMSGWGRPLKSFFASRASRLLPAYWVAVVLVTAVFALPVVAYKAVSPSDALVNLTMLQMPLGVDRVLGVCWTLWAEVRFYALFALCVVLPGANRRRVIMFCAGWMLAAVIAQNAKMPLLDIVAMPEYAPFFIGGVGLYLVHLDRRDAYGWGIVAVSWLIGQHYAVQSLWHAPDAGGFSYRSSVGIMLVVTFGFVAVAAIALGWLRRANWRWLTVAGALTYPFYLVHEHLGWVVIHALHRGLGLPSAATFALTAGSMLLLAWLLNHYVEKPLTPRLRALLAKAR